MMANWWDAPAQEWMPQPPAGLAALSPPVAAVPPTLTYAPSLASGPAALNSSLPATAGGGAVPVSTQQQGLGVYQQQPVADAYQNALASILTPPPVQQAPPVVAPRQPAQKDGFDLGNTLSAAGTFLAQIPKSTLGAVAQAYVGGDRPDQYPEWARWSIDQANQQQAENQQLIESRKKAGASDSTSEALLEASPSSGFTGVSMLGGIGGFFGGTAATGTPIGGAATAMGASGALGYRMAKAQFLDDAFRQMEEKSLKEQGRALTEAEKADAYQALEPIASNTGLWEAGPEAVGNAVLALGGGTALGFLGKETVKRLASSTAARLGLRATAGAIGEGTEILTEGVTQYHQGNDQAKLEAYLSGQSPDSAKPQYEGGAGLLQATKDVAPSVLALTAMMGVLGKAGHMAYKPIAQRRADQQAGQQAGQQSLEQTALNEAALADIDETQLALLAGNGRQVLADHPRMPVKTRDQLQVAVDHLEADLTRRASGDGLRAVLTDPAQLGTLRGTTTLAGMADPARVGQLSDADVQAAERVARVLADHKVPGQEWISDQMKDVADAYRAVGVQRQRMADIDGAIAADQAVAGKLADDVALAGRGDARNGITPEYARASLDDGELNRRLLAGERLLTTHAEKLTSQQQEVVNKGLDALRTERAFRDATPDWREQNARIMQANDPAEVRFQQAFAKNPAKAIETLGNEHLPLIDQLIAGLEARISNFQKAGTSAPSRLDESLALLRQRREMLAAQGQESQPAPVETGQPAAPAQSPSSAAPAVPSASAPSMAEATPSSRQSAPNTIQMQSGQEIILRPTPAPTRSSTTPEEQDRLRAFLERPRSALPSASTQDRVALASEVGALNQQEPAAPKGLGEIRPLVPNPGELGQKMLDDALRVQAGRMGIPVEAPSAPNDLSLANISRPLGQLGAMRLGLAGLLPAPGASPEIQPAPTPQSPSLPPKERPAPDWTQPKRSEVPGLAQAQQQNQPIAPHANTAQAKAATPQKPSVELPSRPAGQSEARPKGARNPAKAIKPKGWGFAKEPWEMTFGEFARSYELFSMENASEKASPYAVAIKAGTKAPDEHVKYIRQALQAGRAIPENVLAEYPGLNPSASGNQAEKSSTAAPTQPEKNREERKAEAEAAASLLNQEKPPAKKGAASLPLNESRVFPKEKGFARRGVYTVEQSIEATDAQGNVRSYDVVKLTNDASGRVKTTYQLYPSDSARAVVTDAPSREAVVAHLPKAGLTLQRASAVRGEKTPNPAPTKTEQAEPNQKTAGAVPIQKAKRAAIAPIDPATDDILAAIAKLGGLDRQEAERQGIDPAHFAQRGYRIHRIFTKDGRSFDDMAETLAQDGYPVTEKGRSTANALLDAVQRALAGSSVMTPRGVEVSSQKRAEEEAARRETWIDDVIDYEAAGFEELSADERITAQLVADASRDLGEAQTEAIFESVSHQQQDSDAESFNAALQEAFDAARQRESQTGRAETGQTPAGTPEEGRPILTNYSREDLAREQEAVTKAQAENAKREKSVEQKEAADRSGKDFLLTGGNRPADVALARGQKDLLDSQTQEQAAPSDARRKSTSSSTAQPKIEPSQDQQRFAMAGKAESEPNDLNDRETERARAALGAIDDSGSQESIDQLLERKEAGPLVDYAAKVRIDTPSELDFISRLISAFGEKVRRFARALWVHTGKALALALAINVAVPSNFSVIDQARAKDFVQSAMASEPAPVIQAVRIALTQPTTNIPIDIIEQAQAPVSTASIPTSSYSKEQTPEADSSTALDRFRREIDNNHSMNEKVRGNEKDTDPQWGIRANEAIEKANRGERLTPMEVAFTLYGEHEYSPEGESTQYYPPSDKIQKVLDYFGSRLNQDKYPWCAPFISYVHARAGIPLKIQSARAFLKQGKAVSIENAKVGDLLVMRNSNPDTGGWDGYGGHVVFIVKRDGDVFWGLGGNQNDEVNVTLFHSDRILGVRRIEDQPHIRTASKNNKASQKFAIASNPSTSASLLDSLKALAGNKTVQDLIDAGKLYLVERQSQLPSSIVIPAGKRVGGAVDPKTGRIYLVAENIEVDDVDDFIEHEAVHLNRLGLDAPRTGAMNLARFVAKSVGLRGMLGDTAFEDVLAQVGRMRDSGHSAITAAALEATEAMTELQQNPALFNEETLAYFLGNPKNRNLPLFRRILAAVRAFLVRAGFRLNLTPDDLVMLARTALNHAAPATENSYQRNDLARSFYSRASALGAQEPTLTADELLNRVQSGDMEELTPEQWAMVQRAFLGNAANVATGVDSPTFKSWFGNSRIKGRDGKPLVMYHGTGSDFTAFDATRLGTATDHPTSALGFFFTNDRSHAQGKYGANVMEVYLAIEKPYAMTDADLRGIDGVEDAVRFREKLERQGYDGVIMPAETRTRYVAAFRPDQIKFTRNQTYTRNQEDMRFAMARRRPDLAAPRRASEILDDIGGKRSELRTGERLMAKANPSNWAQMLKDLKSDSRPTWLGFLTQDMQVQLAREVLPEPLVRQFDQASEQMGAQESEMLQQQAFPVAERWQTLMRQDRAQADALSRALYLSTWLGIDPRQSAAPAGKALEWGRAKSAYDALTHPAAKTLYGDVLSFYQAQTKRLFDELQKRIDRHSLPHADKVAARDLLRQEFERMKQEGPYVPLMRFGDLTVYAEPRKAGEKPVFAAFESVAEQRSFYDYLKREGYSPQLGVKMENIQKRDLPNGDFVGKMAGIIDKTAQGPEAQVLKDALYQLFLHSLPEQAIRKHFLHRKFVPGYSADALRTFAAFAYRSSKQIARLAHSDMMSSALRDMAAAVRSGAVADPVAAGHLVNELDKSFEWMMNPTAATWASRLTNLGFLWHLGASPAHLFLNLSQQAQVTAPWLAGELYGKVGFGGVAQALLKANADFLKTNPFRDPAKRGAKAIQARTALEQEFNGDMGRALKQLEQSGKTDKTQTYSLAGLSEEDSFLWAKPWLRKFTQGTGWFFHVTEVINREASAIAAYRLGRQHGMNHDQAYDLARRAIDETHFDYSPSNRARYMRGNVAKVITLFKQYSLNMTWQLGRNAYLMSRGATPQVKAMARTKLLGMLGVTMIMAGAAGLPFYDEAMWLLTQILNACRDDDDPLVDADDEFRKVLTQALGYTGQQATQRGLLNAFVGVDFGSRVKLDDLWWRSTPETLHGKDEAYYALEQALGPVAGLAVRGLSTINGLEEALIEGSNVKGATWRALEGALPKVLKDISRALRYQTEGATTLEGAPIMGKNELSIADSVGQVLGFTPAVLAERQEQNRSLSALQDKIRRKRSALLDTLVMAYRQNDEEMIDAVQEDVTAFNQRYPAVAITGQTLARSLAARARKQTEIGRYGGVALDRRLAPLLLEDRSY